MVKSKPNLGVSEICAALQDLQRMREWLLKTEIMHKNRLRALTASQLGYSVNCTEEERKDLQKKTDDAMKKIVGGEDLLAEGFNELVRFAHAGIQPISDLAKDKEKTMTKLAKALPLAKWVQEPNQLGFGLFSLAQLIGEAGNLDLYPSPGKLWKRFGLHPLTAHGKTQLGSTWKSGKSGSLTKSEWKAFGYSPRRRSIAYVWGESIVKHNKNRATGLDYEYRRRYVQAKERSRTTNPHWWKCKGPWSKSKGEATGCVGAKCKSCGGTGVVKMHAHMHGMCCATKLLIKNVWRQWHGQTGPDDGEWQGAA